MLILLCKGEGLSKVGNKKDLVNRLAGRMVSKAKEKGKIDENDQTRGMSDERFGFDFENIAQKNIIFKKTRETPINNVEENSIGNNNIEEVLANNNKSLI
ncbi:7220_t:CDS:2, partial [Gigaspora margarita]